MARPNIGRTIGEETNLAARVQHEREARGWSYEALSNAMTAAGCRINASAIYKIEKGEPRRKITVDELVAFSRVFDVAIDDLLTPMEFFRKERAKEISEEREEGLQQIGKGISMMLTAHIQALQLAVHDYELFEFIQHNWFSMSRDVDDDASPVPLFHLDPGDGETVRVDDSKVREAMLALVIAISEQSEVHVRALYPHLWQEEKKS